ncbi:CLCA1 regulator, partial [Amia calva]|nr:CLCA1 regulator [Amia calva]
DPYTLQYDECGKPGRYIHLTPNFLLNDNLIEAYGPRGKVFVHEWAHLRWGVYDEYNHQTPFYISKEKRIEATRCSKDIKGTRGVPSGNSVQPCSIDPTTGLPTETCQFFPEKNQNTHVSYMYVQSLPAITGFCNDKSHNTEAQNMQNRMCNYRSVWSVIGSSEDFKNSNLMVTPPPAPQFTVLQKGRREICLVLDVSGSMSGYDRITRLRQAASLFLREVVEEQSMDGIVQFHSVGSIIKHLTLVHDDASREELVKVLPTSASGGTRICEGIKYGFEVLRKDDQNTDGNEILLLSDGESPVDCLPQVNSSGVTFHAIALGPNYAPEIQTMVDWTGGILVLANDKVDSNGLVDAFNAIKSSDGDLIQQSIQLESSGLKVNSKDWFNGTVSVDKTVGKDTSFLIIWETTVPEITVRSPSGKVYGNAAFVHDTQIKTSVLGINGIAETGDWTYSLLNTLSTSQSLTITVTSRAANASVPPLIVKAHMNQESSNGSRPMLVFAEVSQDGLPVILADVRATIESSTGTIKHELQLLDNGAGADVFRHDGIYSRYFTSLENNGVYSLKVRVQGQGDTARLAVRRHSRALYIPGYVENGQVHLNPQKPSVADGDQQADVGNFSRTASGGAFTVSLVPGSPLPAFPPCKITDLSARLEEDRVLLTWTAPGEDFDQGAAESYEIRMSQDFELLRRNFAYTQLVNSSGLTPKESGSGEEHHFFLDEIAIKNGTIIYFAARAKDKESQNSEVSNIAQAALILPPADQPKGVNVLVLVLSVTGVVAAACIIASTVMCVKKRTPAIYA